MSKLHRTQIYIEEEQMQRLKLEATREHRSVSELIRMAIRTFLKRKQKAVKWDQDPLAKTVGKIKLNVHDASVEHDTYIYGKKRKK